MRTTYRIFGLIGLIWLTASHSMLAESWEIESSLFYSQQMRSTYEISIATSPSHENDLAIPLIVVLDANWYFDGSHWRLGDGGVVGIVSQMVDTGNLQGALLVGVGFVDPTAQRGNAFLLQYRNFYRFLADELLPSIEENYSIDPEQRFLIGHSDGGLFTFYAFTLGVMTNDPVFTGFVALSGDYSKLSSAAYDWEDSAEKAANQKVSPPPALYLGAGGREESRFVLGHIRMSNMLSEWSSEGFRFLGELHRNANHSTIVRPGFKEGLTWLFSY